MPDSLRDAVNYMVQTDVMQDRAIQDMTSVDAFIAGAEWAIAVFCLADGRESMPLGGVNRLLQHRLAQAAIDHGRRAVFDPYPYNKTAQEGLTYVEFRDEDHEEDV